MFIDSPDILTDEDVEDDLYELKNQEECVETENSLSNETLSKIRSTAINPPNKKINILSCSNKRTNEQSTK